jgi:hypothetical protein
VLAAESALGCCRGPWGWTWALALAMVMSEFACLGLGSGVGGGLWSSCLKGVLGVRHPLGEGMEGGWVEVWCGVS